MVTGSVHVSKPIFMEAEEGGAEYAFARIDQDRFSFISMPLFSSTLQVATPSLNQQ